MDFQSLLSKCKWQIALFVLSFSVFNSIFSQEPSYLHYTVKDGLPSSTVYHAIQDHEGFIWFGTDAGVSRFDGVNFKNFKLKDGLADLEILKMIEDPEGRIWFLSFNGKFSYFFNGRFFNAENDSIFKNINNSTPLLFATLDSEGGVWFSANKLFHFKNNNINQYDGLDQPIGPILSGETGITIPGFLPSSPDWIDKINQIQTASRTTVQFMDKTDCIKFRPKDSWGIVPIAKLANNLFLTVFKRSVILFTKDTCERVLENIGLSDNFIPNFSLIDHNGNFWVGASNSGAIEINLNGKISVLSHILKGQNVSSIMNDKENNFWFTTLNNGVFCSKKSGRECFSIFSGEPVNGVLKINSSLLFFNEQKLFLFEKGILKDLTSIILNGQLKTPRKIIKTKQGRIIIWGDGGVFEITQKPGGFISLEPLSTHLVKDVTENNEGNLLLIKVGKLPFPEIPANILQFPEIKKELRFNEVVMLPNEECFFGSTMGLYSINNNMIQRWADKDARFKTSISVLEKGDDGSCWVATYSNGIARIYKDSFHWFNRDNGLADDFCKAIFLDTLGNAWVGTKAGLSRISPGSNPKNWNISNFSTSDGLGSDEINTISAIGDSLIVGTGNGLSIMSIKTLDRKLLPPPVYFTRIRILDHDTLVQDTFILPYYQNNIKLDFVGISFRSAGKINYKYRLVGLEDAYSFSFQNAVQYPSLPPGNYHFEVWAQAKDGTWSLDPAKITFIILSPWWATWWFRSLLILVFIMGVIAIAYFRLKALREKNEIDKKLSELKIQALGLQMNPHFIFNSLNSVHHFIATNNKDAAREYLAKFGKLVRGILDQSLENSIKVSKEIELIQLYLSIEKLRMGEKLNYEIIDVSELSEESFKIPAMVVQPYVENAIWHGIGNRAEGGKIDVTFEDKEDFIHITIQDNGVGRLAAKNLVKDKTHKSISTSSIQERLSLLNREKGVYESVIIEDLYDEKGIAAGTKVTLILPVL